MQLKIVFIFTLTAPSNLLFCLFQENHKYYVSQIIKNGQDYWIDIQGNKNTKDHPDLSDGYLLRQVSLHEIIIFLLSAKNYYYNKKILSVRTLLSPC